MVNMNDDYYLRLYALSLATNFKVDHIQETEIPRLDMRTFEIDGIRVDFVVAKLSEIEAIIAKIKSNDSDFDHGMECDIQTVIEYLNHPDKEYEGFHVIEMG